ncbi:FAD/NAD(P)-binding protein [Marininema halotolerans]|uniref:Methylaspartate mutase epsilon subunit n=1 Tax=Marininema halotolerans TaxID=1155944 RepID=A0A1I6R3F7_9BACL|nr:FAD/NAD(P)-binding protein [Marininema halotolerans]SFS59223.1 methylaspartate mutase epsilon subunit [Marininema halotolerans]
MLNQNKAMSNSLRVAIIGSGPRGMSVLERLVARLIELDNGKKVEIFLIDDGNVGTGRIWSTEQSHLLLMNTVAQEISAFSGLWDGKEARPGNGPSFAQWWQLNREDYSHYGGYAPRAYYGEYLLYVLSAIERALPHFVTLYKVSARVESLDKINTSQLLRLSNDEWIQVDKTVISTGHPINRLQGFEKRLYEFASSTPQVTFINGDSVADMDLSFIDSNHKVGIIGMGLTFYDLIAELTIGRGGKFLTKDDGSMKYCPSGREPQIYAGSRSGMPVLARGRNQKPFNYEYNPTIFTQERAKNIRQHGDVHFDRDVLPLLEAELALVYAETKLRIEKGEESAQDFRESIISYQIDSVEGVASLARIYGLSNSIDIDIYHLADPFKGDTFPSIEAFNETLYSVLAADYAEAMHGNVDSPIKAALDVIRNSRSVIRLFVDFGGLDPKSHQHEFLNKFSPISGALSAGPPPFRILQLQALMEANVLTMMGPSMKVEPAVTSDCFHMYSPSIQNSTVALNVVIDARIPSTNITHDCSKLTQSLINNGIFTPFVNKDDDSQFVTGGVHVTPSPFHPISVDGEINDSLYVLGIPTEHTRWFMQSGSSRPHKWIDFMIDADAIAADILQKKEVNEYCEDHRKAERI